MKLKKMKTKKWPWWVKGGLGGIGFYVLFVSVAIAGLAVGLKYGETMPAWLFGFIAPIFKFFAFFAFYPAMYFNNNYEALGFIIPVNLLFYCLVGVIVAFVVKIVKENVELV